MSDEDGFAFGGAPMPEIDPKWDMGTKTWMELGVTVNVDVDPPLGGNPACLCGEITLMGKIAFLHYREFDGETFTDLMLVEHEQATLEAFTDALAKPGWWKS